MSDLLVPFLVGVVALVIVGGMVGMLVAGPLERLTRPPVRDDASEPDTEDQEIQR